MRFRLNLLDLKKGSNSRRARLMGALAVGAASAISAIPATAGAANLLANGSFESHDFSGWTLGGNADPFAAGVYCGGGSLVKEGDCSAYSAAIGSAFTISQTFATVVGAAYEVDFWALFDGSSSANFTATFGGTTLVSLNNPSLTLDFKRVDLIATSPTTTLTFSMRDDPGFMFLDAVNVAAVPEPASWALIGLGLGVLSLRRRRSK